MTRAAATFRFAPAVDVWVGGRRVAASAPTWERVLSGEAVVEVVRQLGMAGRLTVAELMEGTGGVHRVAALHALRRTGIIARRGPETSDGESPARAALVAEGPPRHLLGAGAPARPLHALTDLLARPAPAGGSPLLIVLEGEPADAVQAIARHLGDSVAWIPLQLNGPTPWAGPHFGPPVGVAHRAGDGRLRGPCAHCVAIRLRGRREVAMAAQADPAMHRVHVAVPPYQAVRTVALLTDLTKQLATPGAAVQLREAIRRSGSSGLTWHPVPRGVCPACRTEVDTTPRSLRARLERLRDPLTGCFALRGMAMTPDAPVQMAVACTLPMARWVTLAPPTVEELGQSGHRAGVSSGIGVQREIAQLAAGMEALEGYAGLWRGEGDGVPLRAAWSALPEGAALAPSLLLAFSAAQLSTEGPELAALLHPDAPHPWWPATGGDGRTALVPLALAFDGVPAPGARWWVSNGVAAGATPDAALAHALCELIERDATAIWWHNALPRPRLPLPHDDDTAVAAIAAHRGSGREVALLDLTHDLGIAVRAVVAWDARGGGGMTMGFAADPNPRRASRRALVESCRLLPAYEAWRAGRIRRGPLPTWFADTRVDSLPWLLAGPAVDAPPVPAAVPLAASAASALDTVRAALARAGLAPWVIDLTRPDVGIPVVKAFVPALRFRNRFAPGRLYDVPVRLGWRAAPCAECDLLPFPDGLR